MRRRFAVLSTGRQDWGILRSTAKRLAASAELEPVLLVGGMACADAYGRIERVIEADGFTIAERMPWLDGGPFAPHVEAARALEHVGAALAKHPALALLLVGDRYETLAAATAATLARVPIVHLHGGEETEGAFDNAIRHAISKLAHLHLTSHAHYAERLVRMGEDPSAVHVVGAPGLDNLTREDLADRAELEAVLGMRLDPPVVIVTVHPTTLASDPESEVRAVGEAVRSVDARYVITLPNSDPGNQAIRARLLELAGRPGLTLVEAVGERRYWGLLRVADAVLGNSSSGVIEAPALRLPVVNVGDRQKGRLRTRAVIDVPPEAAAVTAALRTALSPEFRASLTGEATFMGGGQAAERIAELLAAFRPEHPLVKKFR